ncbi:ParB N-terminal domain-containing protein [Micromonospora saelicesensis]|uniref:ParB N-terminal domain-containing protein n=1 Tax=Micromonospora saelicesensis TaxID=285676 RepID=UPI003D8A3133
MRKETFDRLVANVRRDGALTSTPLVWHDAATERMVVLSGNHRLMAAREVGLTAVDVIVVDQQLSRARQVAPQLSHNAIEGEDDPATLKHLYEELDDVDWRAYSGLDDKQLDLRAQVDVEGLSEANLDFATVQLVFPAARAGRRPRLLRRGPQARPGRRPLARRVRRLRNHPRRARDDPRRPQRRQRGHRARPDPPRARAAPRRAARRRVVRP